MKTLICCLLCLAQSVIAQQYGLNGFISSLPPNGVGSCNYANTNTGCLATSLPLVLTNASGSLNWAPSMIDFSNAGWRVIATMTGNYSSQFAVNDNGDGSCNVAWTTNSLPVWSTDYQFTNSPLWTAPFIDDCQTFRSLIRAYQGFGAESNANVTVQTSLKYAVTNITFIKSTNYLSDITNAVNTMMEVFISKEMLVFPGITNTPQFWNEAGHLIP